MEEILIRAIERKEKPKKARRDGFAPGVIYGEGFEKGLPVKFEMLKLKRFLKKHDESAKIWFKIREEQKYGIIKEVQRDPITGDIMHIDIQVITEGDRVNVKLPIVYKGKEALEQKKLLLQIFISELEVSGETDFLPESIIVNVKNKKPGQPITVRDIQLDAHLKIHHDANEVLAVITVPEEESIAS
ncbi:MAG: large subunit ribosomal protein [Clostridiales bacterium]|jgi:large subunit ribosomal protein L25|nr:large subunit ribosomal protein [Clostridiales bacterium]MDK2933297.1 large subunit ribosomal protein [Clostridiales bacterium]